MKAKLFFILLISLLLGLTQSVKADTIHIYLPASTYQSCEDINDFNTFIVHKHPMMTGVPMWIVDGVPVSNGDSLIYTPTATGLIDVSCTWNSITFGVLLQLYSAPPSHASFNVLSGGSINTAGDTAYMCGMGGLSLGANASGGGSFTWYGPGGFTSTSNPIAVTIPGMYVFEQPNTCGITRDSVEVIYLPTIAPVWSDTTFCNTTVDLTLDPGPGWSYSWYAGSSQVNMSNGSSLVPATSAVLFFDSGGSAGDYTDNESFVHTFSAASGTPLTVLFSYINIEDNHDQLIVYDGPNTSSAVLLNAVSSSVPVSVTSTGSVITIAFTSDFSIIHSGWQALISSNGTGMASTTQTFPVTTTGVYTVALENACVSSASSSIEVMQETFPLPDLSLYSQIPAPVLCQNEVAILDPQSGYSYDTYQWYRGSVTPVGNQPTLTVDYATLGSGYYSVEITQGACSFTSYIVVVDFFPDPEAPVQCVSTFDPLTGKNATIIEATDTIEAEVTGYVLCYKQGSNWIALDTLAAAGLSSYTMYDNIHDPNQQSFTYAAFALHSCGNLSPLTDWHKTIRIAIFQDVISSDYVLQIMDDYETMSGYAPDSYTIWIDSLNDGNLYEIGILNGGNSSFTISTPVNGAAYYASVNLPWTCDNAKSANISYSNKRVFGTSDISENHMQTLQIYPNPATNQITISGIESGGTLRLYDLTGKLLLERVNRDNTLELHGIAAGSYVLEVSVGAESESGVVYGRVVVE